MAEYQTKGRHAKQPAKYRDHYDSIFRRDVGISLMNKCDCDPATRCNCDQPAQVHFFPAKRFFKKVQKKYQRKMAVMRGDDKENTT